MKIYLDMDGVISDFTAGWCKELGVAFSNEVYPFPIGLWDYTKWIEDNLGIKWRDIADICSDPYYWKRLPLLPDAIRFYNLLKSKCRNIEFLTSPTGDFYSNYNGKQEWLINHCFMSHDENRMILMLPGESKSIYAHPDTVLIDDKDKNVQEFIKGGGKAILVPRPWNNRHFEFESFEQANDLVLKNLETLI